MPTKPQKAKKLLRQSKARIVSVDNPQSTFERIFEQQFKDIAALRYEQNEEFFVRMFKDEDFMGEVIKLLLPEVYRKLRKKGA